MKLNTNALTLEENYLFSEVAKRIRSYLAESPDHRVLKLSIGDVTRPLANIITQAMQSASEEMSHADTFHGYGDEQGEEFLRKAISGYYQKRGVSVSPDDIFIGDGAKSDLGNLCDLFDSDNTVLLPNPVYPVYYDTSIMSGRRVQFLGGTFENGFLPMPDESIQADIIYLCSPNNPTGAVYTREQLAQWIAYAKAQGAIILFDSAYESYIREEHLPHSIYELAGAETCAIEINSLSKMAGFTGVRCGWTVIPSALVQGDISVRKLWKRRTATKYNGTSYIIQRGAEAVFTDEGQIAVHKDIAYYMENARLIKNALTQAGIASVGGVNAPYVWLRCPHNMGSWECFDYLLHTYGIAGTPGVGFGEFGDGWLRFSSFGSRETVEQAVEILSRPETWNL